MSCLHQSVLSGCTQDILITAMQFIAQAEEKISQCITIPLDPEPQIEQICGPGVDATFDQLISALGHIASQKPKPLIDSMMLWRKNKSDAASEARSQLQQVRMSQSIRCIILTICASRAMPFPGNFYGGIQSLPTCFQMMRCSQAVSPPLPHARSSLPKPNVARRLQFTYFAES